ncbi:alpha/beta fold hydrolase [Streptodolium elevatio]
MFESEDGPLAYRDVGPVDRVLRAVPQARLVRVDGAAHYPNMEQPAAFNRVVEEFLASR